MFTFFGEAITVRDWEWRSHPFPTKYGGVTGANLNKALVPTVQKCPLTMGYQTRYSRNTLHITYQMAPNSSCLLQHYKTHLILLSKLPETSVTGPLFLIHALPLESED